MLSLLLIFNRHLLKSSIMTSKRKHVSLNLVQKLEILNKLKEGYSTKAIIAEYNIGRATVYDLKMKENKLRRYTSQRDNELDKRKSLRKSENDLLDAAVYKWFKQQRSKGLPITGTIIKEKALVFNSRLGGSERFAASEGWLTNWKKRHGIRLLKITETTGTEKNKNDAEEFKLKLDKIIKEEGLTQAQVYNAGGIDLFIKRLPSKTHVAQYVKEAQEQQNEHITLLACCNADGNHKLPLMLIGKSQKPRFFKHPEMRALPVDYYTQKETQMSSEVFSMWFHNKFVPCVEENLKKNNLSPAAILLTANEFSHFLDAPLQTRGIRIVFLSRNIIVQPMHQGILESVKRRYRYNILNSLLDKCENTSIEAMLKAWKSIKMRDVVFSIAEAWDNVEKITIVKCWKQLWPASDNDDESINQQFEELLFSNNLFVDMFHRLPGGENVDEENVTKWFNEENAKKEEETDEEIIKSVQEKSSESEEEEPGKISKSFEVRTDAKKISHAAGAKAAETLLKYLEQLPDTSSTSIALVTRLRDEAYQRQTS